MSCRELAALDVVQEMDIDNRMAMYQHIVLSGGTTMFPGFATRMEKEMRDLYLKRTLQVETVSRNVMCPHFE